MTLLGVNIDHVATLRNARGGKEPEPVTAALTAEINGADGIVCHLREDRRHISERDVRILREVLRTPLQLEMALAGDIISFALDVKPAGVLIVPERRQELTTEDGFDATGNADRLKEAVGRFKEAGIEVSVFTNPAMEHVEAVHEAGADAVELHTGRYANARGEEAVDKALDEIETAAHRAWELGLSVHAGHGLNYDNVERLLRQIPVEQVNIGHAIVSRALFTGFENAVRDIRMQISAVS